jgi:hypothetical protein
MATTIPTTQAIAELNVLVGLKELNATALPAVQSISVVSS